MGGRGLRETAPRSQRRERGHRTDFAFRALLPVLSVHSAASFVHSDPTSQLPAFLSLLQLCGDTRPLRTCIAEHLDDDAIQGDLSQQCEAISLDALDATG